MQTKLRFEGPTYQALLYTGLFVLLITLSLQAGAQVSSIQSGASLIGATDLPPILGVFFQTMGGRMTAPENAQVIFAGTTTDAKGSRSAQISIQAPGYMSYREGQSRAVTFNGTQTKSTAGALTDDDKRVSESLMAHLPDAIFLQVAGGGTVRRVGGHFRSDASTSKTYTGTYWTVVAFSPKTRPGLAQGSALQQQLFICIDERSGLISEIRSVVNTGPKQHNVTQTQFSNWSQQGDQWFPGQIVRLENGAQTLSFTTQQATFGPAVAVASFEP